MLPLSLLLLTFQSLPLTAAQQSDQPASTSYTDDTEFRDTVLNITNTYRQQHNATGLSWNSSLADTAQKWSERCKFEHSGGPTGENLSSGFANTSAAVIAWGSERKQYSFSSPGFSHETGHFTQLVWRGTRSVGCGRSECNGKGGDDAPGWFVVCEYDPPGNVEGQYRENVLREVPREEWTEGPADPRVPVGEGDGCPLGGVCSVGGRVEVGSVVWVVVVGGWLVWGVW